MLNSGCIEKSQTLKIVRIRILHMNLVPLCSTKNLCGAIYYGIIHTCNHMNANKQNFHVALFVMRWEGIPTFTWEFDNIPRSLCCTHGNHVRYWNLLPSCHYSNLLQDLFYYTTPQKANSATTKTRGVSWTK